MAPSKQESTTYEPSLVCKLLILGCRPLIPDRLLALVAVEARKRDVVMGDPADLVFPNGRLDGSDPEFRYGF